MQKQVEQGGEMGQTWRLFVSGLAVTFGIPGLILIASAAGFGALARDAGLSPANAVLMMGVLFALPAQVVMVDQLARGGSLIAAVLAVSLIGLRLLPMSVVLAPYLGGTRSGGLGKIVAVHAVAITAWIEGLRRLPGMEEERRLPHFLGIGSGLLLSALLGTWAGYALAGVVSPAFAAALLFLTPIYFMLSLMQTASRGADWLAMAVGAVLGPLAFIVAPGFDLLLTGVAGGTVAYVAAGRWQKAWSRDPSGESWGGP